MKANEFVKTMGLEATISFLRSDCINPDKVEEVKRLVESHELVGRFGGLEMAKGVAAIDDNESYLGERFGPCDELKQAIADVESCQGEPHERQNS